MDEIREVTVRIAVPEEWSAGSAGVFVADALTAWVGDNDSPTIIDVVEMS